jgi:uncharacterized membrane protein YdbT with pleckstrin-like domain
VTIPDKLLGEGEHVVIGTRTHVKALLGAGLLFVVLTGVTGFLAALPSGSHAALMEYILWGAYLVAVVIWVVTPFLRWLTATYTLTNRRLITRSGLITRRGRDFPISRINDVGYEHGPIDRLLGCGTLIVSDASETGSVVLHDIPDVERFHLTVNELIHAQQSGGPEHTRRLNDGT